MRKTKESWNTETAEIEDRQSSQNKASEAKKMENTTNKSMRNQDAGNDHEPALSNGLEPASRTVAQKMVNPNAVIQSVGDFDAWLDVELEQLESRFADFATANSYRNFMGR